MSNWFAVDKHVAEAIAKHARDALERMAEGQSPEERAKLAELFLDMIDAEIAKATDRLATGQLDTEAESSKAGT